MPGLPVDRTREALRRHAETVREEDAARGPAPAPAFRRESRVSVSLQVEGQSDGLLELGARTLRGGGGERVGAIELDRVHGPDFDGDVTLDVDLPLDGINHPTKLSTVDLLVLAIDALAGDEELAAAIGRGRVVLHVSRSRP